MTQTITPEQFYRATKEIIDRCVAPNMYANAMSMLDRAMHEAGASQDALALQREAYIVADAERRHLRRLLIEAHATFTQWKDVVPAISLCRDIDAALSLPHSSIHPSRDDRVVSRQDQREPR